MFTLSVCLSVNTTTPFPDYLETSGFRHMIGMDVRMTFLTQSTHSTIVPKISKIPILLKISKLPIVPKIFKIPKLPKVSKIPKVPRGSFLNPNIPSTIFRPQLGKKFKYSKTVKFSNFQKPLKFKFHKTVKKLRGSIDLPGQSCFFSFKIKVFLYIFISPNKSVRRYGCI